MIKIFNLIVLGLVWCLFGTCRHEEIPKPCDCGQVTTIEELREWAFFKEGTYWIYEEETSHERDTITVINSHDFITDQGNVQFDYETFRSSDGYNYWFWFNEGWTAKDCNGGCCDCRRLWCDKYISGDFDGEDVLFTFPGFIGNYAYFLSGGGDGGKVEITELYSSVSFGEFTFDDVLVQHCENSILDQQSNGSDYYEVKYYYGASIGIIRKEISENEQIWNLVEFTIQQ